MYQRSPPTSGSGSGASGWIPAASPTACMRAIVRLALKLFCLNSRLKNDDVDHFLDQLWVVPQKMTC